MVNSSTLTEYPVGNHASVNTDPPCGKHVQTMIVKMKNKRTGRNKRDSSVQYKQKDVEQHNTLDKSMQYDIQYIAGGMKWGLSLMIIGTFHILVRTVMMK